MDIFQHRPLRLAIKGSSLPCAVMDVCLSLLLHKLLLRLLRLWTVGCEPARRPIRERSNQTRTNHAIPPGPVSPCCADSCLPWDGSRPFALKLSRHPFGAIGVWAQLGLRGPRGCRWMVFFARHREMQTFSATKRGGYVWFIRHTTRGAGSRTLPASILLDGPAVIHPSEPGRSTPQFTPNLGARPAV